MIKEFFRENDKPEVIKNAELEAQRIINDAKAEAEKIRQQVISECEEIKLKASKKVDRNQKKSKSFFSFFKKVLKNKSPKQKEIPDTYIIPVLRINITNYYNCISYQLIHRATDRIFKERDIFSTKYHCPNEKEIRTVTGSEDSTITREATSAYFADYVLEGLDENFKKQAYLAGISYFRRHDDIFLSGNKETCKKVANYICEQLQIYDFSCENNKDYLSSSDREKIEEIFKSEPSYIVRFYIDYIRNVDTNFYKDMQKYTSVIKQ